jgi:hypothetical protein
MGPKGLVDDGTDNETRKSRDGTVMNGIGGRPASVRYLKFDRGQRTRTDDGFLIFGSSRSIRGDYERRQGTRVPQVVDGLASTHRGSTSASMGIDHRPSGSTHGLRLTRTHPSRPNATPALSLDSQLRVTADVEAVPTTTIDRARDRGGSSEQPTTHLLRERFVPRDSDLGQQGSIPRSTPFLRGFAPIMIDYRSRSRSDRIPRPCSHRRSNYETGVEHNRTTAFTGYGPDRQPSRCPSDVDHVSSPR